MVLMEEVKLKCLVDQLLATSAAAHEARDTPRSSSVSSAVKIVEQFPLAAARSTSRAV